MIVANNLSDAVTVFDIDAPGELRAPATRAAGRASAT
jgi:hypothetical protein